MNITVVPYIRLVGKQGNQVSTDLQLREEWRQFILTQTVATFTFVLFAHLIFSNQLTKNIIFKNRKPELGVVTFLLKKLDSNADISVYLTYLDCAAVIGYFLSFNKDFFPFTHTQI